MVLAALGSLAQIAASRASTDAARDQLRHQHAIEELRTGALAHVVDALITRRVELVHDGFVRVLTEYATQAEHFMAQQTRFVDAELETRDPLRRIELRKRLNDIDVELRQIRVEARRIYNRMTEVILLLGGTSLVMNEQSARYLAIPAH
jgi:hypothetical protein